MPTPLTARIAVLALVIAAASGCASTTAPPTSQMQHQPPVQLLDPDQTPRDRWSDAMVMLRGDMGLGGQRDIPKDQLNNDALITAQRNARLPGGGAIPSGGAVLAATGYASPPTGFSAGGAAGMSLALGFLTAPPLPGPAQQEQVAAWVPIELAADMEQATRVATQTYNDARKQAYEKVAPLELAPSRYPRGTSPSKMFPKLSDVLLTRPVLPAGGPGSAPSFLPQGQYFGPIFFARSYVQLNVDSHKNDLDRQQASQAISAALPDWFVVYSPGLPKMRKTAGQAPVVYHRGRAHFFVSK